MYKCCFLLSAGQILMSLERFHSARLRQTPTEINISWAETGLRLTGFGPVLLRRICFPLVLADWKAFNIFV